MPYARTNDRLRISYEEHGDGTPLLLAYGIGGNEQIKGSRLVVLSPASHFANRDQPEAWNRAALEFLARVDRRR